MTPSELAVGAGRQRNCAASRRSTLKMALSRRCCSQPRAMAISSSGRVSSGRGTWSVGGISGTGVSGGASYGEATVDGVTKVPPHTEVYQLEMVVPSVTSFGFLPSVSKEASRLVTLVEF